MQQDESQSEAPPRQHAQVAAAAAGVAAAPAAAAAAGAAAVDILLSGNDPDEVMEETRKRAAQHMQGAIRGLQQAGRSDDQTTEKFKLANGAGSPQKEAGDSAAVAAVGHHMFQPDLHDDIQRKMLGISQAALGVATVRGGEQHLCP
ncbi:unnamed protein product [Prorocentrum cordatum]|uniref:Uncharacterized protein n=1 Tax=Prorocentrum cordatum TaxID=2364126 RepID=A0ABN9WK66_9DINO|nr:unnamed protein product [Polarella glacialis]